MRIQTIRHHVAACLAALFLNLLLALNPAHAAEDSGMVARTKEAVKEANTALTAAARDTKEPVKDAARSASDSVQDLWSRVDESRLKHRTRDEIVAWVIMGALAGGVAGMFTSLKSSGAGRVGRLLLGLAGALLGGMVVHVGQINFGWGPVLIRYEELLCSLLGALVLILVAHLIRSKAKNPTAEK